MFSCLTTINYIAYSAFYGAFLRTGVFGARMRRMPIRRIRAADAVRAVFYFCAAPDSATRR